MKKKDLKFLIVSEMVEVFDLIMKAKMSYADIARIDNQNGYCMYNISRLTLYFCN